MKRLLVSLLALMLTLGLASCGLLKKEEEHIHTLSKVDRKEATCTKDGNIEYWTCSGCLKLFSDRNATNEIKISDTVIAAKQHNYDNGVCTQCGENVKLNYELSANKEYYIVSGIGEYTDPNLVIPGTYKDLPVASIGDSAFYGCSSLTSIMIPDSVTSIGSSAFKDCYKLVEVYNLSDLNITKGSSDNGYVGYNALNVYTDKEGQKKTFETEDGYIFYEDGATCYLLGYNGDTTEITLPESCHGKNYKIYKYAFYNNYEITEVIIENGVVFVDDYAFRGCTSLKSVTIGESVTSIGSEAFRECTSLESVTIGDSVVSIGNSAFQGCTSLVSVTIGNSVASIGTSAFYGCSSLTSITIPDSVTSIGGEAFRECTSITNVIIPDSVTFVGDSAFQACTSLVSATIGNKVTSIGSYAFGDCTSLESVTVGNSVTSIGSSAFSNCKSITKVYIGDIVKWCSISFGNSDVNPLSNGAELYLNGDLVTELVIPDTVKQINAYAFSGCSNLTIVTIPNSVTSIGSSAFKDCYKLVEVYNLSGLNITKGSSDNGYVGYNALNVYTDKEGQKKTFENADGFVFYEDGNDCYLLGYNGDKKNLTLPNSCHEKKYEIYQHAFRNNDEITGITIQNGVVSIGAFAFYNCKSLTKISISNNVTSIGENAFYNCTNLKSISIGTGVKNLPKGLLAGCGNLESITVPFVGGSANATTASSSTLFGYIFGGNSYTGGVATTQYYNSINYGHYYIPSTLKSVTVTGGNILYGAFYNCTNITSITIPNSVTSIGSDAFYNCTNLRNITIPKIVTSIGSDAFYNCTGLQALRISDIASWCNISFGNYSANPLYYAEKLYFNGKLITELVIPDGVTSIPMYAFYRQTSITKVTIPNSVTSICASAFEDCTGLKEMYIGNIGAWCNISFGNYSANPLYYAEKLHLNGKLITELVIPDGVTSIPMYAFYRQSGIEKVTIPNSVTSIGKNAFYNCTGIKEVHISDLASWCNIEFDNYDVNPLYYAKNLYLDGNLITELIIPNTVVEIKIYAFYGCTSFTSVTITDNVTSIGSYAFSGCKNLTTATIPDSITAIGSYSFRDCTRLTSVIIPNSVTSIGECAFYGCSSLESVTIGNRVASVGNSAFKDCTALTEINFNATAMKDLSYSNSVFNNAGNNKNGIKVVIGKNVTKIPDYLFCPNGSSNTPKIVSVEFEEGSICKSIGASAFYGCTRLTSVTIANSVTYIGDFSFYGCTGIKNITIPDSVISIGASAFYNCTSLRTVTVGNSVASIDTAAFYGCTALTEIRFNATEMNDLSSSNSVFYNAGQSGNGINVIIGKNVTKIPDYLFCPNGSSNTPKIVSVEFEEDSSCKSVGSYAFSGCITFISVTVPNSVASIGKGAFYDCSGLTSVTIGEGVASIGDAAFKNCYKLVEVYNLSKLPITTGSEKNGFVGKYARDVYKSLDTPSKQWITEDGYIFYEDAGTCYLLGCTGDKRELTLPENCSGKNYEIYKYAFYKNDKIMKVTIANRVTFIGESALSGCCNLKSITIPFVGSSASETKASSSTLFGYIFGTSSYIGSIEIKQYDGSTYTNYYIPSGLTSVTVTGGNILYGSFSGCTTLTSVTIENSVTSIGESAFSGCDNLKDITIPFVGSSVSATKASSSTLFGYIFGTSNYYGNSTQIKQYDGSSNNYYYIPSGLTSVTVTGGSILYGSFSGCTTLTSVTIGNSVTSIGGEAFRGCTSLASVTIGNSVTSIGGEAFRGCTSLASVTIGNSVTSIGESAFSGCDNLVDITISFIGASKDASGYKKHFGYIFGYSVSSVESSNSEGYHYSDKSAEKYYTYNIPATLETVIIADGVKVIGDYAFNDCNNITNIVIPDSVTAIGTSAFAYCASLTSITIPESVTSIGENAFCGCGALTEINFNAAAMNDLNPYNRVFFDAGKNGNGIDVVIGASVTKIPDYLFYPYNSLYTPKIISVVFEEESECKSIGEYAFGNCTYITSIEIPSGVTSIGKAAFYECQKLKSIIIPKSVTSIGDSAFEDCTALDCVYYEGTAEDWAKISIDADNSDLTNAARYYYSEVKPAKDGNFWHYDYDGKAVLWNEK